MIYHVERHGEQGASRGTVDGSVSNGVIVVLLVQLAEVVTQSVHDAGVYVVLLNVDAEGHFVGGSKFGQVDEVLVADDLVGVMGKAEEQRGCSLTDCFLLHFEFYYHT